jgi:aminoglycoside 2''-phosphotransferase
MLLDEARCRRILSQAFPELAVRSVEYFASGWDYEVWEANGEWLFRFPLRGECAAPLLIEARLLRALAGQLSLAVPEPGYVSEGCEAFAMPFFAYRKLPGEPLSDVTLGDEALAKIAAQLGRFLSELHSFPLERARELGVPCFTAQGWRKKQRAFRARCDGEVSLLLSVAEREAVTLFWNGYLNDDANFAFMPVLIHADLGMEHILINKATLRLTGVIDFGDACVGDPALDFAGMPPPLREAALRSYARPADGALPARADVYLRIGPFHDVLYGLHIDEQAHVAAGLAGIRERVLGGKKHK